MELNNYEQKTLKQIRKHYNDINELMNRLSSETQEQIGKEHNPQTTLQHCNRWGLKAVEEILEETTPTNKHTMRVTDNNETLIDDEVINEKIFERELSEYRPVYREDEIDHLIMWISESNRPSDKELMKQDLEQLQLMTDKWIFSSISTNDYVDSENAEEYDDICEEILKLNKGTFIN